MSNYYLCDRCENMRHRLTPTVCACTELGEVPMRVMVDRHGKGGIRYDDPNRVCGPFRIKEDREKEEGNDD